MKPYTLTNREGESISPMTSTKTVFDEKGVDLDTLLSQQRQDADNALKDYAKKTEVTQGLNAKQDKLTPTTDLHITDDNIIGLTEPAKVRLFDDMWRTAVDVWGDIDHDHYEDGVNKPYMCNKIWMDYEEAICTYLWGNKLTEKGFCATDTPIAKRIRTNLPPINTTERLFLDLSCLFEYQSKMEVCRLTGSSQPWVHLVHTANTWLSASFKGCTKLRVVLGVMNIEYYTAGENIFQGCISLEDIQIFGLKANLNMSPCPKLSVGTMSYLVTNAANTSPITITVHPDVYAKLTGDTTNEAAASLTAEELAQWGKVLTDAVAKNISFATV